MKKSELKVGMQCMITDKKSSMFGALIKIIGVNRAVETGHVHLEFVENFIHPHCKFEKGDTITNEYKSLIERDSFFYKLNKSLYQSLLALWEANKGDAGGSIDYPSKDYGWISDTLDFLAIKYFCEAPDGDEQERNFKSGDSFLTDKEAYEEMLTRFNNTRI